MACTNLALSANRSRVDYPVAGSAFSRVASGLSLLLAGSIYLVGWAGNHTNLGNPLLSTWSIPGYILFILYAVFLVGTAVRHHTAGYAWRHALPQGYTLALVGVAAVVAGILVMLASEQVFGPAPEYESLTTPGMLIIDMGMLLILSAPLRAAWAGLKVGQVHGWRELGPFILSASLALSLLTFTTQFAHPISQTYAVGVSTAQQPHDEIYVMKADGTAQTRLAINSQWSGWGPVWSPDGRKIIFTASRVNDPHAPGDLYVMNDDGSDWTPLVQNGRTNYLPAWSHDGKTIAFLSQVGNTSTAEIHTIRADGSNEKQLTHNNAWEYGVSWSPDDKQIVFGSVRDGLWQIYTMDANGSNQRPLPNRAEGNAPAWSPDGTQIVFTSDRYGTDDIFVMNVDGSNPRRLTVNQAHDDNPQWSPDGRQIVFVSNREGTQDIFVMSSDGSNVRNLTQAPGFVNGIPAWSPDGSRIAYLARANSTSPAGLVQPLGVVSILLQTALLMGVILLLVGRWSLPFGALTLIITVNAALLGILRDQYALVLGAFAAGLILDVLLQGFKPSPGAPGRWYSFAFLVPVVVYALYFAILFLTRGVEWSPHLWIGSIVEAGIVGLLVGFLIRASTYPVPSQIKFQ